MKIPIRLAFATFYYLITSLQINAQKLAVVPYVSGITSPIDIKNCGDNRLFIADRTGLVRVIDENGNLLPAPFLDITSKISSNNSEEGFLGFAFSPDYKTSGKFYVDYTSNISGQLTSVVEEYKVSDADSNVANVSSALVILTQPQPASNHNGGNLMFGNDDYLYINFGDGGNEGDPDGNGQNKSTFLGKILRINVSNSSQAQPYTIPGDNPFFNDATPGIKKEIWAYGVRNPWRSSVDRLTGDLWIADVGQNAHEEVDYQPVNAAGGRNYGWNITEGNSCYNPPTACNTTGITFPIYDYPHTVGSAVTGGYVYRSAQSRSLFGTYIFGDYVAKWIDGIQQSGGIFSGDTIHFITASQATGNPISFGEDRYGDQYILFNGDGTVYKLEDTSSIRRPKAYFTAVGQGEGAFLFRGLEGRNLSYQWLRDNTIIPGATSPDYATSIAGNYTLVVTNTLNFSDTSVPFTVGALPLRLISFTAKKTAASRVDLQWETASEENISGFTVQKKRGDESAFSDIGFVRSQAQNGISNTELTYRFIDSLALISTPGVFYRLQIENTDGSYSYSDIRSITTGSGNNIFTLYPNPAKEQVRIYLNELSQPMVMILYDNSGKKVKEQILYQQNTTIELPHLKGLYFIQLSDKNGENMIRKRLMVQ